MATTLIYDSHFKRKLFGIRVWSHERIYRTKGFVPFDSAPGGSVGISDDDLSTTIGAPLSSFDFITLDHPIFCAIPTYSSLDIPLSQISSLDQDFSDVCQTVSSLSSLSRYDGSTDNSIISYNVNEHNQFHALINETNADFIMDEIFIDAPLETIEILENTPNEIYNFGKSADDLTLCNIGTIQETPDVLDNSIEISNNGRIWVNKDNRISFIDQDQNPFNTVNSHFDLNITSGNLCDDEDIVVSVINNGEFIIGDWINHVRNTANVYVTKNATLEVSQRGEITIDNRSKLIIENGGIVNIQNRGMIQSKWNTDIIVKEGGVLKVESGGILRPQHNGKVIVEEGGQLIL